MSDEPFEEPDEEPDEIVSATADLLEKAGQVIAELKRRDAQRSQNWEESPEMTERVLVAQLLGQMDVSRRAIKQLEESNRRLDESKKGSEEARKRLKETEERLKSTSLPAQSPTRVPPVVRPLTTEEMEKFKAELAYETMPVEIVIYRSGAGWLIESFIAGEHVKRDCPTFDDLTQAFAKAAVRLMKMAPPSNEKI